MQKWEYLRVDMEGNGQFWVPHSINGQELRDWKKGPNFYDFANQLGDQGWELIAPITRGGTTYGYIFKRLKA